VRGKGERKIPSFNSREGEMHRIGSPEREKKEGGRAVCKFPTKGNPLEKKKSIKETIPLREKTPSENVTGNREKKDHRSSQNPPKDQTHVPLIVTTEKLMGPRGFPSECLWAPRRRIRNGHWEENQTGAKGRKNKFPRKKTPRKRKPASQEGGDRRGNEILKQARLHERAS